jgi:Spy/CpxP family protein refolding chaperone
MKIRIILFLSVFSLLIPFHVSHAQPAGMRMKPGMGMRQWGASEHCRKAADLNLSPDQEKTLELIEQTHFSETRVLRAELFLKRLEFRESLTNPSVRVEAIRSNYGEMNDLETKLEEKTLDYLVKIRGILTSEQLKNWCPEQEISLFRRMLHGAEPTGPKPSRSPPFHKGPREE